MKALFELHKYYKTCTCLCQCCIMNTSLVRWTTVSHGVYVPLFIINNGKHIKILIIACSLYTVSADSDSNNTPANCPPL